MNTSTDLTTLSSFASITNSLNGNLSEIDISDSQASEYIYTDNIVNLPSKSEECVIGFLRSRYEKEEYYTWAGRSLIAIRPFEKNNEHLNYGDEIEKDESESMLAINTVIKKNCSTTTFGDKNKSPEIKTIVSHALFRLEHKLGKCNQSIVITGESGSGKTYSSCVALKCISKIQNCKSDILLQAWSAVPLLTAFGNAITARNNNSSRYGQLFQLQYEGTNLKSVSIKTFLLEKSRVSGPNEEEGNFHIFQQILDNEDNGTLNTLCLSKTINYKICGVKKIDMSHLYQETLRAFDKLQIPNKMEIYKILSVILNLGNVRFCVWNDNFVVSVDSLVHIENASKILEADVEILTKIFTTRLISVKNRKSIYNSVCISKAECQNRLNCMMRYLYEKLFQWLVKTINKTLNTEIGDTFLGILDIYGFEVFENNLFEQLCINYANEKLQCYFVKNYFFDDKEFFEENLDTKTYSEEYQRRLRLFDDKSSLFSILNETCLIKSNNDMDDCLMERLSKELKSHSDFAISTNHNKEFTIIHYTGPVKYNIRNMISKNTDKVPEELIDFLRTKCNFEFLKVINSSKAIGGQTILSKFKKSLDKLINVLEKTDVHYIKCIKTNNHHIANFLDQDYFKNQLYANGIFEILKLAFQGYSIKLPANYYGSHLKKVIKNILQEKIQKEIYLGSKYIYMNEAEYLYIEKLQNFVEFYAATKLQLFLRRHGKIKIINKDHSLRKTAPTENVAIESNTNEFKFKRNLHHGDCLVTYSCIPDYKIMFHTAKTCILNSHLLPRHARTKGLPDIL